MNPMIKNLTSVHFDICKASINTAEKLLPGEQMQIVKTIRAFCTGHSSIGGFLIVRYHDDTFEFKSWGSISLNAFYTSKGTIFEITENS